MKQKYFSLLISAFVLMACTDERCGFEQMRCDNNTISYCFDGEWTTGESCTSTQTCRIIDSIAQCVESELICGDSYCNEDETCINKKCEAKADLCEGETKRCEEGQTCSADDKCVLVEPLCSTDAKKCSAHLMERQQMVVLLVQLNIQA